MRNECVKGKYVCREYNKGCYSPVREIKTISQAEADYWDRIEKQIRMQRNK